MQRPFGRRPLNVLYIDFDTTEVTPLLYSALEAEQVIVQERALQTVPRLCQVLEYAHVKEVTYPALVKLFVSTRTLSCKIQTLMCFHSMIEILDKHTITEKLVPVLARVKTREPSVMVSRQKHIVKIGVQLS